MNKRIFISMIAFLLPLISLIFGIYGTFTVTFSIPLLWQVAVRGKDISTLGIRKDRIWASLAAGLLSGVVLAFLGGTVLKTAGLTGYALDKVTEMNGILRSLGLDISIKNELGFRLLRANDRPSIWLASLFYSVLLVGLGEEMFWRGFFQAKMKNFFPVHVAIWITAAVFGLMHFYLFIIIPPLAATALIAVIALLGAFWGYLYRYFGNIWAPAVSHGLIAFISWKYFIFSGS
ncbi:MAG: CPBP family intramembrane metalloprotease [Candidatus Omnitrophica bacterium]|nr:CPBP family intramembrane metalloprotease [Candidatus Omnitrophota bacterium]